MSVASVAAVTMEDIPELNDDPKVSKDVEEDRNFTDVRRKRKREKETEMDVSEGTDTHTPSKKPFFPPVDASSVLVSF